MSQHLSQSEDQATRIADLPWARERLAKMAANALINSRRFGLKLLKGFGYPDEVFSDAQDYQALSTVLQALSEAEGEAARLRQQLDMIRAAYDTWYDDGDDEALIAVFRKASSLREDGREG